MGRYLYLLRWQKIVRGMVFIGYRFIIQLYKKLSQHNETANTSLIIFWSWMVEKCITSATTTAALCSSPNITTKSLFYYMVAVEDFSNP